jgi:probable rRNA maturation factor
VDPGSSIRVVITDGRGRSVRAPGLAAWLARIAPKGAPEEISIALVSDQRIRALNRQYRRKDQTTDVLSFEPADLAIATGVARRQAREAGLSYADELKTLALHGLLHLMGYDHHARSDRGRMARLERRLRAEGGLPAGLIERASRASDPRARPSTGSGRPEPAEGRSAPSKRRARAK